MENQSGTWLRSPGLRLAACAAVTMLIAALTTGFLINRSDSSQSNATASDHASAPGPGSKSSAKADSGPSLRIDSIHLDHALTPQGLRSGEINPDAGQVIWFSGSQRVAPGQEGVSVVAGHVAWGNNPDVFANLSKINIGDPIVVVGPDGVRTVYTASRTYAVSKNDLQNDPAVWGQLDHGKRLVLVTCDDALGLRPDGHRAANYVIVANAAVTQRTK